MYKRKSEPFRRPSFFASSSCQSRAHISLFWALFHPPLRTVFGFARGVILAWVCLWTRGRRYIKYPRLLILCSGSKFSAWLHLYWLPAWMLLARRTQIRASWGICDLESPTIPWQPLNCCWSQPLASQISFLFNVYIVQLSFSESTLVAFATDNHEFPYIVLQFWMDQALQLTLIVPL